MGTTRVRWPSKTRELRTVLFDSARWNGFKFRDSDIVIVTWGKSGTTWMQQIVGQLILGAPEQLVGMEASPWLDFRVFPLDEVLTGLEAQNHRRFIKTHLPVDALVFSPQAKYIYIGRDTRDVAWSAYNHHASFTPGAIEMINALPGGEGPPLVPPPCDVREYYLRFIESGEPPGFPLASFWPHVQGWWDLRELPNVLLMHFNDLKADLAGEIRRVAEFLDIEIDAAEWPSILEHCGFEHMRKEAAKAEILDQFFTGGGKSFIHKGTNGRWKDVLSTEEIARCDEIAARRLPRACARWLKTGELDRGD